MYSVSPYNYSGNNPLIFLDPSGFAKFTNRDGEVIHDDKNEDTKDDNYYVNDEAKLVATDEDEEVHWDLLNQNPYYGYNSWADFIKEHPSKVTYWTIGDIQVQENADDCKVYVTDISNMTGRLESNDELFIPVPGIKLAKIGGKFLSATEKVINHNNWVRVGVGTHKEGLNVYSRVLRIGFGARGNYINEVPKILQGFNRFLSRIGRGGHVDLYKIDTKINFPTVRQIRYRSEMQKPL